MQACIARGLSTKNMCGSCFLIHCEILTNMQLHVMELDNHNYSYKQTTGWRLQKQKFCLVHRRLLRYIINLQLFFAEQVIDHLDMVSNMERTMIYVICIMEWEFCMYLDGFLVSSFCECVFFGNNNIIHIGLGLSVVCLLVFIFISK